MREILHLTPADARRVPWRNGRGVTEELAIAPDGASFERGDFDWRVSRARVVEDGPFSAFPGFERILVVTAGAGLVLSHGDDAPRARLRALEPHLFSGDWTTRAELVSGPVADFNVVFRRGAVDASVEVLRLGRRRALATVGPGDALLCVVAGALAARAVREEEPYELDEGDSLLLRGLTGEEELDLVGADAATAAVVVRCLAPSRSDSG